MKIKEFQHQPVKPDTYEASMALNQLMRIGKHAIKLHNMIDDAAEMESWVAKKIDLAGDYVKKVYNYTEGEKAGLYDDGGMTESREEIGDYAKEKKTGKIVRIVDYTDDDGGIYTISYGEDEGENDVMAKDLEFLDQTGGDQEEISKFDEDANNLETAYKQIAMLANNVKKEPTDADDQMDVADDVARPITKILSTIMDYDKGEQMPDGSASKTTYVDMYKKLGMLANKGAQTNDPKVAPLLFKIMSSIYDMDKVSEGSIQEDAGEGHMSKSTLYHTAKYAIELMDMINKGDDLEGWVQSKLNKAADYLQGVYNYEEYQKLNPYREELDSNILQRHAGIVQKHIDEILAKETKLDDIDTKPGMMRILAKRVNEVEKEIAKETRKNTEQKTEATELDEGIKEWGKRLAMAGIIVAGLAGVNSINNAIDNSIPAISAMNTALEMAQDSGNDELAKMIEKDLADAKVRLNSGKDLPYVVDLQNKYAKFIKSESLGYESQLALALNQRLK